MAKAREKERTRRALSDRKSQASGARLRNVVSLIEDDDDDDGAGEAGQGTGRAAKKRKAQGASSAKVAKAKEGPPADAGFGDDEEDWMIYRQIVRAARQQGVCRPF